MADNSKHTDESLASPEDTVGSTSKNTLVTLNTLIIGILVAIFASTAISLVAVKSLSKRGMLRLSDTSLVTLDTNKLVAAHAKFIGATANTPGEMQELNKRFLVSFQKNLDAYTSAGITIVQSEAVVASANDVTDQFLNLLVSPQPTIAAQDSPNEKAAQ